ncbi:MAG: phosphoenolpyruvate carboxykinase (ATP) [Proteobacteria bacterium]|nr:MAG: phosphoenolpyruvate carboxykinase (ATP) [Pseudomonadota bacterium]
MLIRENEGATTTLRMRQAGLEEHGIHNVNAAFWNLGAASLVEHTIQRREGSLASDGSLVVRTGQFTGRSPKDKFIVRDEITDPTVQWGAVNQPMSEAHFERLYNRMGKFWQGHDVYVQDCFVGADPAYGIPVRIVSQLAWHSLFGRQLFIRRRPDDPTPHDPQFTILFAPEFQANPAEEGTNSETCIVIDFKKRVVLICGTSYAGEMKKSAFTIMNYLLPGQGVFPMHCSANVGARGDVALFFGLSGTGKTTLSADPKRGLIGDDEHGWSDQGVFNFEGGCYAKCIRLSRENEPQIWNAIRFGTVLENVVMDVETRHLDFNADTYTENTRAAYPLEYIENAVIPSVGGHPENVIFLTADAFGVLPPISRLTPEQAMYHFLSGYTAKVAGTERGLGNEPQATFSACFGSPFLPRPAAAYASLLGERLRRHQSACWLVNTGWTGGPFGVGSRMKLPYTRAMLNAALAGELNGVEQTVHPVFRVAVPKSCPGIPSQFLDARGMWADKQVYDRAAIDLSGRFNKNFEKFTGVSREIAEAAPAM